MRQHLEHCVTEAIRSDDPAATARMYDELMELMYRDRG
jgi:hypothetical protein